MFDLITRLRFRWMLTSRLNKVISKIRRSGSEFIISNDQSPLSRHVHIELSGSVHIDGIRIKYGSSVSLSGIEKGTEILLYKHLREIEVAVDAMNSNTVLRDRSEIEIMREALEIEGKTPADELLRAVDAK